ncbi:hypothetical protein [Ferruginibacter sp. HRS2-29]|uniref:hypothetical protein n=1 Tax=Ferruginibacter sp. HRS2-29 TaxID=2487334 RepID=UPI0020CF726B|nr:hypothetical protein [Ferruginibacter sp. HRS2-29]MCP9749664.1 hypothetical protein [Ferruginibacter sp. HRS2-29]
MNQLSPHYHDLLYRYARRIVQHPLVAIIIVDEVNALYKKQAKDSKADEVREFLHTTTLQKCRSWMDAKDNVLDARQPKQPT